MALVDTYCCNMGRNTNYCNGNTNLESNMTPECIRKLVQEWECHYSFYLLQVLDEGFEGVDAKMEAAKRTSDKLAGEYNNAINQYVQNKFQQYK